MQPSELVIVKSFPSEPVVRCIYEDTKDDIFICFEKDFKLWEEKGTTPVAVKCPKARVFRYDEELYRKLRDAAYSMGDDKLLEALWNQAESYYSTTKAKQE